MTARNWISFFDADHPIYVNARHRDVHNALIASGIVALIPCANATLLDYGCGEALHADRVARHCGRLILSDAGPNLLAAMSARFAGHPTIEVRAAETVATLPDGSVDLLILNSVAQYLSPQEADALFRGFRRLLAPGGRLFVGDIIPPGGPPLAEVWPLLRFAAGNGFLSAALAGLLRTAFSSYPRLRAQLKLTRYAEADMMRKLAAAGFRARRMPRNIGHDQRRMSFLAEPEPQS